MSLSLVDGILPIVLLILGAVSLVWLGVSGQRLGWKRALAVVLAACALTALIYVLAEYVFRWWNASLPRLLYLFSALTILGVQLAVLRVLASGIRIRRRVAGVAAGLLVLLALAGTVNIAYHQYPTVAALFTPPPVTDDPLPRPAEVRRDLPAASAENWTAPPGMPAAGKVFHQQIPGGRSGYASNPALIYLPPAYLADPGNVNLPVLVLVHGQPGSPEDWLVSGGLAEIMDSFAARHHGLAPVVVLPDLSNAGNSNWPLCLDTTVSNSATYLAQDLPAWVQDNLGTGTAGPQQWAIGGYSYGGTCAVQLAANYPGVYPTFLDIAGENEPTVAGGHHELLDTYFNGDEDAFRKQNAADLFAAMRFPDTAGIVVVGQDDKVYAPEGKTVYDDATAAGANVQFQTLPGGHSWQVWGAGLENNLSWLCTRLGILEP
ncbi:alpha/beta hydrolase-fold protein [Arthrobacter sp. zg-Y20]|uniref:alpha/beta hydrolase n=1 Tax=unclassified Arthrobacter TaxID=235627 RepID=UPI001D15A3D7|nr:MULTISPECIES: alpha/beta fold hydrolase [unclassified Arthrobacter]WIB06244.1 alpha/beta hydrolase-fold protein [Arthrobacter sp. zg-Y20]